MANTRSANRLARATSPYLKQHQFNPVDWYEWGPEAWERARREDKPLFLSIGYSTCHWCHVMAHECFENPGIAALMNEHFVSVKVDREERPDLDETYMNALQVLTGRGGWPLNIFLTPELQPFYGGTYFPPEDRAGLPGFSRLLLAVARTYQQKRETVTEVGRKLAEQLHVLGEMAGADQEPAWEAVRQAAPVLIQEFDPVNGGFGGAPKFPRPLELGFLLHWHRSQGDQEALEKVAFSLEKMAAGGIYDQVGGGFHRYTVDQAWVVPHFEKMLYDSALLVPLYLALYQLTGRDLGPRIARETLDFALRDLAAPQGGFYSGWDADSEGVEGKYYVWTLAEVEGAVGPELAPLAAAALGVTKEGNFEGANILTRPLAVPELAARFALTPEAAEQALEEARARLAQARAARVPPHRDEKIITAWNGLMFSALALGAQVLGEPGYADAAARGARFLLAELFREDRLHRIWSGGRVAVPGFLEDYAFLANALLDLYETDFDPGWLAWARRLAGFLEERFLDPADGTYFYVARDEETALVRSKSIYEQALPSGNSMAARVHLRLWRFTEEACHRERARALLGRFQAQAAANPWGLAHLLTVQTLYLLPPLDLTLVGDPSHPQMREMLAVCHRRFLPERRLVRKNPADCAALEALVPGVREFGPLGESPVAYLCQAFTCRPPVTEAGELADLLAQLNGEGRRLGE